MFSLPNFSQSKMREILIFVRERKNIVALHVPEKISQYIE